jgi:hypothetical protein
MSSASRFGTPAVVTPSKSRTVTVDVMVPLIGGEHCVERRLRSAAVRREPVGDHVHEQIFHQRGQTHLPTMAGGCWQEPSHALPAALPKGPADGGWRSWGCMCWPDERTGRRDRRSGCSTHDALLGRIKTLEVVTVRVGYPTAVDPLQHQRSVELWLTPSLINSVLLRGPEHQGRAARSAVTCRATPSLVMVTSPRSACL